MKNRKLFGCLWTGTHLCALLLVRVLQSFTLMALSGRTSGLVTKREQGIDLQFSRLKKALIYFLRLFSHDLNTSRQLPLSNPAAWRNKAQENFGGENCGHEALARLSNRLRACGHCFWVFASFKELTMPMSSFA